MNLDATEQRLRSQLSRLLRRSSAVTSDLRAEHDDDWVERASELENDDVLEQLDDLTRNEVQQVRQALRRIQGGQYGRCVVCHSAIPEARLEAMPTADRCVGCQSPAE